MFGDALVRQQVLLIDSLYKNGSLTRQTVDSFSRAVRHLRDLDPKALESELLAGVKDSKVDTLAIVLHLKELLVRAGWTNVSSRFEPEAGSCFLKDAATGTYILMQYCCDSDTRAAGVDVGRAG